MTQTSELGEDEPHRILDKSEPVFKLTKYLNITVTFTVLLHMVCTTCLCGSAPLSEIKEMCFTLNVACRHTEINCLCQNLSIFRAIHNSCSSGPLMWVVFFIGSCWWSLLPGRLPMKHNAVPESTVMLCAAYLPHQLTTEQCFLWVNSKQGTWRKLKKL